MKKNVIIMLVGLAALISYLFLPYVSFGGNSLNFIDLADLNVQMGFLDYFPIIAAIAIIIAGFMRKYNLAFGFSIAGLVAMLAQIGGAAEQYAQLGVEIDVFDVIGIGFWITTILFIAGIILPKKLKNQ